MDSDVTRWRRSYKYLPYDAGEEDIATADTRELLHAYRFMADCETRPAGMAALVPPELTELAPQAAFDATLGHMRGLFWNQALRFVRTCREVGRRLERDDPQQAASFFRHALLAQRTCYLASDDYDSFSSRLALEMRRCDKALDRLRSQSEAAPGTQELWFRLGEYAAGRAMVEITFDIREIQDAWNFWITACLIPVEERMGHEDQVALLKDRCLELLRSDDYLWREVMRPPRMMLPAVPERGIAPWRGAEGAQTVRASFPADIVDWLKGAGGISAAVESIQSRLDLVVEKLIDIDQRTQLTWERIRELLDCDPQHEQAKDRIERSLAAELGETWAKLESATREDLVDAEFVFEQCSRWRSGWGMAVVGYFTALERELTTTYLLFANVLGIPSGRAQETKTLGQLARQIQEAAQVRASKTGSLPAGAQVLLQAAQAVRRLNSVRRRATHPADRKCSEDDAGRVRQAVLKQSGSCAPILATLISARRT